MRGGGQRTGLTQHGARRVSRRRNYTACQTPFRSRTEKHKSVINAEEADPYFKMGFFFLLPRESPRRNKVQSQTALTFAGGEFVHRLVWCDGHRAATTWAPVSLFL